jgi:hypothetical protein
MRRTLWILAAFAMVAGSGTLGRAQQVGFSDPFFLYYGYFLPQQAARAAQPNVTDTINAQNAANQAYALTNRANLYDPNGNYGAFDRFAPNDPYSGTGPIARGRNANQPSSRLQYRGIPTTNINGNGPGLYYNRAAQYYPGLRSGRGPNRNVAQPGKGTRGGGMPSPMGALSMPSPGPR